MISGNQYSGTTTFKAAAIVKPNAATAGLPSCRMAKVYMLARKRVNDQYPMIYQAIPRSSQ